MKEPGSDVHLSGVDDDALHYTENARGRGECQGEGENARGR